MVTVVTLSVIDPAGNGGRRTLLPAETGHVNAGFCELKEAAFPIAGEEWRLLVDDAPLDRARREDAECWIWSPGFHAGTVRAELVRIGERKGVEYLLDVSPDPGKIGQLQFQQMVREIWSFDASLVLGDEAAGTHIGEAGDREDPAVRYMRLARYADELMSSAGAISRQPHRTLRAARRQVALHRVRRADIRTAIAAIAGETAMLFTEDASETGQVPEGGVPLFDVPISEETYDSAANRTMAALLTQVIVAVDEVTSAIELRLRSEGDEDARHELARRWPRRRDTLRELREAVGRIGGREPFRSIKRREMTSAGLTAIAAHPLYARTQQIIWRMTRPGYEGARLDEWSSMSPTWSIYESWCFIAIVSHLEEWLDKWKWTRSNPSEGRYCVTGKSGSRTVAVHLQKSFSYSSPPPKSGLWSVSAHLIPDIVIVLSDGDRSSFLVLDAKYRRGRQNVLDGMRSAHIYRDALRLGTFPPVLSLLLVPADAEDAEWTMQPAFRAAHGVGVVVLSSAAPKFDVIDDYVSSFFHFTKP